MDFAALKAQIDAARRLDIPVNGATFKAILPTDYAYRLATEANADEHGRTLRVQMFRAVLKSSVIGWEGVKTTDILPGVAAEPLAFSADALDALLDADQDLSDALILAISEKARERRELREAARKN